MSNTGFSYFLQLGSLYYRFGDLQRAELLFATAGESCRKIHDNVLWSVTLSNLAVVQLRLENSKDAEKNAKAAVELVQKIYSKKCGEVSQPESILLALLLFTILLFSFSNSTCKPCECWCAST